MSNIVDQTEEVTDAEILSIVVQIVDGLSDKTTVSLENHRFDRVPCSRRKLYAVCRKYASQLGYEYVKAEYVPSGNPAFKKNHKRGYYCGPYLFKIKNQ